MDPVGLEVTAGDFVMVQLNPDDFKLYQDGHGGWTDQMAEVRQVLHHVTKNKYSCTLNTTPICSLRVH